MVIYIITAALGLQLTTRLFQTFFSFFVVIVVIIFQRELRRFFENFSLASLNPFSNVKKVPMTKGVIDIVIESIGHLASQKTGAIIVFPGQQNLDQVVDGGFAVNGRVSEPLILSIFDNKTPGHDGAMIIENNLIKKFGVHLPLAENFKKFGNIGTRHRASLGLSEVSDALIVTVSEERGTISISKNGDMKVLADTELLKQELNNFLSKLSGESVEKNTLSTIMLSDIKDKLISVAIAILLWIILVGK